MFENNKKAAYVKFKDGKLYVFMGKNEDGTAKTESFDSLTGYVTDIQLKEGTYNGEVIKTWNVKIEDNGEVVFLQLGYSSGTTRGFFNSLANADLTKPVRIYCYVKESANGKFTCAGISQGDYIRWKYDNAPKTKKVKVGSKEVVDDSEAIAWTFRLVDEIKANIQKPLKRQLQEIKEVFNVEDDGLPVNDDLPF